MGVGVGGGVGWDGYGGEGVSGCVSGGDGMGGFDMRFGWVFRLLYIPYIEVKGVME